MTKLINYLQLTLLSFLLIIRIFLISKPIPYFVLTSILGLIFLSICISNYQIWSNISSHSKKLSLYSFHLCTINLSYMVMFMYIILAINH